MVRRQPVIALVKGLSERPSGFRPGRGRRPRRSVLEAGLLRGCPGTRPCHSGCFGFSDSTHLLGRPSKWSRSRSSTCEGPQTAARSRPLTSFHPDGISSVPPRVLNSLPRGFCLKNHSFFPVSSDVRGITPTRFHRLPVNACLATHKRNKTGHARSNSRAGMSRDR